MLISVIIFSSHCLPYMYNLMLNQDNFKGDSIFHYTFINDSLQPNTRHMKRHYTCIIYDLI